MLTYSSIQTAQFFLNHIFKHNYILRVGLTHMNQKFWHKLVQNKPLNWFSSINVAQHTNQGFFYLSWKYARVCFLSKVQLKISSVAFNTLGGIIYTVV